MEKSKIIDTLETYQGDPRGVHEAGARPGGGRALHPRGHVAAPPAVFSVPKILKYSGKKSYFIFRAFGELLFLGYFYCKDNSENRQKIVFLLYLI